MKKLQLLLAFVAGVLWVSTAYATAPLDHFQCYRAKASKDAPKFVPIPDIGLSDQFELIRYDVKRPLDLCNPAEKRGEPVLDSKTHLKAYRIVPKKGEPKHVARKGIVVFNQFHPNGLTLETRPANQLLVPSSKDHNVMPPPPDPTAHNVDHYKCYKVVLPKGVKFAPIVNVPVRDQFNQPKLIDMVKPKHLCNPTKKLRGGVVEPIKNENAHLVCYQVRPSRGQPKHLPVLKLNVNNQFGPEILDTVREDEFCVPAKKRDPRAPRCGDGVRDTGEQCDAPDDGACPGECQADCTCPPPPRCGDGVVNPPGEQCEPPGSLCNSPTGGTGVCDANCQCPGGPPPSCGDGVVNPPTEKCDPPGSSCAGGLGTCDTNCQCVEVDYFPATTAQVTLHTDLFGGVMETVDLMGETTIHVDLGGIADRDGNGLEEVETEIVMLDLTGMSQAFGPVLVQKSSRMKSKGMIEERQNQTNGILELPPFVPSGAADSFFDVFVEVTLPQLGGVQLHNPQPKRMRAVITHKPPREGETYADPTPVELYDWLGRPTRMFIENTSHTPTPAATPVASF